MQKTCMRLDVMWDYITTFRTTLLNIFTPILILKVNEILDSKNIFLESRKSGYSWPR